MAQSTVVGMPARDRADACPGALSTHTAADGELARVRVPGGRLSNAALTALADAALEFGDGTLHLTARANVQVRALSDVESFAARLDTAGLVGPPSHERVRNVLASPLSGISGGLTDVGPLVPGVDRAICASSELADLPGRFLFGLDDGRGDVADPADERVDVCWRAVDADRGEILFAGARSGLVVPASLSATMLVSVAEAFLRVRGDAWQVRELDADRLARLFAEIGAPGGNAGLAGRERRTRPGEAGRATRPGIVARDDGGQALIVGLPFGVLTHGQARVIGGLADDVVLTPWRSIVLPVVADGADAAKQLVSAGLTVDADAPEQHVTACIGMPGCAKSRADVRADATRVMPDRARQAHFAGCERRCGRPPGAADVVADGEGYRVDGTWVPLEELQEALSLPPRPPHPEAPHA